MPKQSSKPAQRKSQTKFTVQPPATPPTVIDQAAVLMKVASILDGKLVPLELGGEFEAVMTELGKRGWYIVTPTTRQLEAWIFPVAKSAVAPLN